ncbi:MAG: adenylate/guanylate cyclase domain-containing protein [Actinomycetota bacterium]
MICPRCGEDNPERFRFCGVCGTPLTRARPTEERKVVSVLFVDMVGFTSRSAREDPEDVQATLRPYHALLKREIERFGGTVEKFVGDAVMAVFGAPVAHEDDPERAVRAALRIIEAIEDFNAENPRPGLAVRGAVNTGEVVVALGARPEEGESMVVGDVVNTASRLQQAAPVGGVVVGDTTYRSTSRVVEYEPLEPVTVKGKADPIPIWRAVAATSRTGAEIEPAATPFIGRREELALLQQTFGRMRREPSVQLVTITGEPGVGKSRLVRELFGWIEDHGDLVSWRQGRCLPYGEGITFWALGEIVKAHCGILESDPADEARRKVSEAVAVVSGDPSEREWLGSRLGPLVGLPSPQVDRDESFAAWRGFLEAAALARPLVLVVEDLHWADDAMLEFVEHVAEWSTGVPILFLCTARPELYERRRGWGGGMRNSATITLSALTDEETSSLVTALLADAVLPADTREALLERSGGNPLYAEEFVRMLTDRELLERRGETVVLSEGAEILVPDTVQGLIAGRLDTLSPERKNVLQDAAVVGTVFWSGAVARMGGRDESTLREDFHELTLKEFVRPVRLSSMEHEDEYGFWHVLVRDVAYGQIPRAVRAVKHLAAAEWIERAAGGRVDDHAELLAHHYEQALELTRAAGDGQAAAELAERARPYLVKAGERAMRLDLAKAASYLKRALASLPEGHPERPSVLARVGFVAQQTSGFAEAVPALEEAIAGFEAAGDLLGAGAAKVQLADILHTRGETAAAGNMEGEAVRMLEELPPSEALAYAYVVLARRKTFEGLDRDALDYSEKALAVAEASGAREQVVRARQFRGFARLDLGDLGGLDDLREGLRLGLEWGLGAQTAFSYLNLGDWLWSLEGPAAGLEIHRQGIAFSERRGLSLNAMWTRAETTWMLFELGRWDELAQVADQVAAIDRAQRGSQLRGMALPSKARVHLLRGEMAEAGALAGEFLPLARQIGDLQVLLPALAVAALIEHAQGDVTSAVRLAGEWAELHGSSSWLRGLYLPEMVALLAGAGETGRADALVQAFIPRCSQEENLLLSGRAILGEATGDLQEAARLHGEATERWAAFGNVVERGRSLLGEGRVLAGLGRAEDAGERLRRARRILEPLGAAPLVAEIARLEGVTAVT